MQQIKTRIQQKTGLASDWAKAVGFIPLAGEIIIYTDLHLMKIGDGTTNVNDLPFVNSHVQIIKWEEND